MGGKVATGDTSNLSSGRDLSTTFLQIDENNFSFFSCHARKPYSHKGFRRLQAGKLSGKIFPLGHQFRRSAPGKQREGLPGGTYQEINPRAKDPRGREGKEGRIGKGINGLELIPWEPIAIASKYPQQSACCFAQCFPFKVLSTWANLSRCSPASRRIA
jgi:hypothetical protein